MHIAPDQLPRSIQHRIFRPPSSPLPSIILLCAPLLAAARLHRRTVGRVGGWHGSRCGAPPRFEHTASTRSRQCSQAEAASDAWVAEEADGRIEGEVSHEARQAKEK